MQDTPYVLGFSEPDAVEIAARLLREGAVLALPTETLYGFSCLAHSQVGVRRIMRLKAIERRRGFVALAADVETVERYLAPQHEGSAIDFLRRVWPAPLTAVLVTREALPWGETQGGLHTAAFRVPAHPELLSLLRAVGEPLLSTSLNRTGQAPLVRPEEILQEFGDQLDLLVLDDADPVRFASHQENERQVASSLADFTVWPPQVLRAGEFDLQAALQAWKAV
jgi:L-threonylcarbamoyladenylate synthase